MKRCQYFFFIVVHVNRNSLQRSHEKCKYLLVLVLVLVVLVLVLVDVGLTKQML